MPLSEIVLLPPDVVAGHEPRPRTWRLPVSLVAGGVALVLVGALTIVATEGGRSAGIVDASGSMVVEHQVSDGVYRPHGAQSEHGNRSFSGRIRVELWERRLVGTARLRLFFADPATGDVLGTLHSGGVYATFGTRTCRGPFPWTFYGEPRATGGSMSLRCDDGSLFAATVRVYGDAHKIADRPYPMFVRLGGRLVRRWLSALGGRWPDVLPGRVESAGSCSTHRLTPATERQHAPRSATPAKPSARGLHEGVRRA